jgi:hypothetical protein
LRNVVATAVLALAVFSCASAAAAAGLNLAWDKCLGEGGASAKTFACNTNTGYADIVGSFIPALPHPKFVGIEVKLDFQSMSQTLPAWWQFHNVGTCRESNFEVSFSFREQPRLNCEDPFDGGAYGGVGCYATPDHPLSIFDGGSNNSRLVLGAAVMYAKNLSGGAEYYAFRLRIQYESSTGGGACEGCATPVCLSLAEVAVFDEGITDPETGQTREPEPERITQQAQNLMITWQDSSGSCQPKVRNKTWGQLKSLYR